MGSFFATQSAAPAAVAPAAAAPESAAAPAKEEHAMRIRIVETAQKGEGMSSYATYKIQTRTNLPGYNPDTQVERRYNDFVWLREQLAATMRGHVVPPLPEKTGVSGVVGNRFSPELLEYRRRELEKFLSRLAVHSALSRNNDLRAFLTASDDNLAAIKLAGGVKSSEAPKESGGFWGILGSAATKVSNLSSQVLGNAEEFDKWFEQHTNYINTLELQFNTAVRAANSLSRKHAELEVVCAELAGACANVASAENGVDKATSESFSRLADIYAPMAGLFKNVANEEVNQFEEQLKDYVRYMAAVKDMLRYRLEVLAQYQGAARAVKDKREKAKTAQGPALTKLQAEIAADEKVEMDKKDMFEKVARTARSELETFEATKTKEIKAAITKLVQLNMNLELQIVDMWKIFLAQLQKDGEP